MTNALAALGVLALVSSGQFTRTVSVIVLVGLGAALAVRESWQRLPGFKHVDTVALILVIALQVTRFVLGASSLDVLIEFAAALQIIRLATRRGAVHDQQVIVLALLHLIAGTVLGGGLGYGLCFAGVLVVAPGALVLSHLRREVEGNYRQGARDRTGLPVDVPRILRSRRVVGRAFIATTCLLSIPIFLFTASLFVAFPRVGLSLLMLNQRTNSVIGFSDRVELHHVGVLRDDPTVAARVEVPNLPDPPPERISLHLRGTALDSYDGHAWSRSDTQAHPAESFLGTIPLDPPRLPAMSAEPIKIELETFDPPVLFFPPGAAGFVIKKPDLAVAAPRIAPLRGSDGEFRYEPRDHAPEYLVYLSRDRRATFQELVDRDRYLHVPASLPPRVRDLAASWTAGLGTPVEKARAIEKHLREEYAYDLGSPSGKAEDPLDDFLFESKRGHCEYYSTAMAIMLRTLGVPTRNVTGFGGGTYNRFGKFYVVRHGDAHSWVEVWLDGEGWQTFDPTPSRSVQPVSSTTGPWATLRDLIEATAQRWDRHVVNYDLDQQYGLFRKVTSRTQRLPKIEGLSPIKVLGLGIVGLGLAAWVGRALWRRRRAKSADPKTSSARTKSERFATQLYENLEQALAAHGVHRAPGTPPLRHAEALEAADHPLATDVVEITREYLAARFGGIELTEGRMRELDGRIRELKGRDLRANGRPPKSPRRAAAEDRPSA
jgi:transglutaminase-like putative cysteine protease